MTPSPLDTADKAGGARYTTAWSAIMQLAREGKSWSGHERNAVFLNSRNSRFASAAVASGLDFADDARAIGFTDWDQDGDVDIWLRNRSGPRLRLMLNRSTNPRSIAIKLEGTTSNRDAIGAQVFVEIDGQKPQVKSVRAGDLYLSQSSKWLHFGLADTAADPTVKVRWPGGKEEGFGTLAAGDRFHLKEGNGTAQDARSGRGKMALTVSELPPRELPASAKILLPARVPLPPCEFATTDGKRQQLACEAPTLLLFWSADCPHCTAELADLSESFEEIRTAGVQIVALSTDALRGGEAQVPTAGTPFPLGFVSESSMSQIQYLQTALFDQGVPPAVPLSFLLTSNAEVAAIYRGRVGVETLIADAALLRESDPKALRNHPLPYAGRWYTQPASRGQVLGIVARQFQSRFPETALSYLALAAEGETGTKGDALRSELAQKHYALARHFSAGSRDPKKAEHHFSAAIRYSPSVAGVHIDFGAMLGTLGRLAEAKTEFERALALEPANSLALKNLQRVNQLLLR